ncbi:DMT family transporter [Halosquirtibacter xylanolyticus]|uniref:DMT family transporter n=1 Tax=Halosquirtibacter xylanolyticus TaxID=3374599 RepID=UPI003748CEBD|nr:DMT family transporter [Prolixibacteraceae bacterium]
MKNDRTKGYILSILATIFFCHIYIFSKKAMEHATLSQFCFYWFGLSLLLNGFSTLITNPIKKIKEIVSNNYKVLITLGLLEIIISITLFSAIHYIPNTAVAGMLGNLFPIFTVILGITILKEKIYPLEYIGLIAAFVGILVTSFPEDAVWRDFLNKGTILVIVNCIVSAIATIIIKSKIQNIPPLLLNSNRAIALFIYACIALCITKDSLQIPPIAIKNIAIGAVIGPFIAINLVYYSFKYMEASRATVIQSTKGLVLIVCTYLYWGELPKFYQVAGGIITLAGLIFMSYIEIHSSKSKRSS